MSLLPRAEEKFSKDELPRDVGNEFGETVIEERKIRIAAYPSQQAIQERETSEPEKVELDRGFATMKGFV